MEYIQLDPANEGTICNPTKQQKSIYDFYESRQSENADDIYSSEWYRRTMEFTQQSSMIKADAPILLSSWEMIETLDFGPLFLSHPIAAYAFWQALHAFYDFDKIVCGHAERGLQRVESWKALKPFVYLKSRKIRNQWRKSLNVLKHEIECEILEGEDLLLRLQDLLSGVSGLESALTELEESFAVNLSGMMFVDTMLEKVAVAVDERRNMIANLLRLEDNNATFGTESDESRSGTFGEFDLYILVDIDLTLSRRIFLRGFCPFVKIGEVEWKQSAILFSGEYFDSTDR